MMAEVVGNSLGSGLWTSTCGNDKKNQSPEIQCSGGLQLKMSSQRSCFLGVETRTELRWENWKLGGEFTKNLFLKNVRSKLLKLRYRPPVSKIFTTLYPQIITLSPGTSFSLPVTFRPLDKCEYQDAIEFHSKDGSFVVSLRATLPCHALDVPESVLLPTCAVLHQSKSSFTFRNARQLQTRFQWEAPCPFQLSPETGLLEGGQECCVTVLFRPQEALVHQVEARCVFGDEGENTCTVLLQGLSKYPFLQVSAPGQEVGRKVLEFGSVAVGCTEERHFDILNPSTVTTSFSLSRIVRPALLESVFHSGVQKGEVAPRSSTRVSVSFCPVTVDTTSVDYLSLTCPGALSKTLIKVTGTCTGSEVTLSCSVLDFGCVDEGQEAMRTVDIVNSSSVLEYYQFDVDSAGHSIFILQPRCGTLPANSSRSLTLLFRPQHPIGHHRRVACLLLHREPLFLDLLGTCHSEELKPAILRPRHLVLYQKNHARGLTWYPPDILSALLVENKLQLDQDGALLLPEHCAQPDVAIPEARSPMEEYFQGCAGARLEADPGSSSLSWTHVTVDPPELTFYDRTTSSQAVTIYNHTKGKISLIWMAAQDSPFSVTPSSCDLGALKSTAFRVSYTPQQHNTFHGAQLECFALYKVLKDHREVQDCTLCPSWCVMVRVTGHCFQPDREHFIPHFSLQHPQVNFPPLSLLSYRTVLLENTGDLPLIFRLDPEACPSVSVQPTIGLVQPGQHQILTLATIPAEDHPAKLPIILHFNASAKHTQELSVVSTVEKLRVCLEGDGSLFFKPTAVGSCSQRTHRVRNFSSLPLQFRWRVSGPDQRVLSVEPDRGVLQPNDTMVQTWSFKPLEEMVYNLKPNLTFWAIQMPGSKKSRLSLKFVGMASKGSIKSERAVLDLGEVLVGDRRFFQVPLMNNGSCPVSFSLSVQQSFLDPDLPEEMLGDPAALELGTVSGTIPARTRQLIRSTVMPARRARYSWVLSYQTLNSAGSVLEAPQHLCQVQAVGVYPTLEVIDSRCHGSTEGLSKLQLWRLFSLDQLNAYLKRDPAPPELTYRVPTRHSLRRSPPIYTSAMLDFNFSAAPLGSEPSSMILMFENTGSIDVDWCFLFPEDQQIDLEFWAETGEFSSTELYQMKVQEDRLFNIAPRSGKLHPGQQKSVTFTYRHDFSGLNRIPVLFKLSHGREILLNFLGVTVERERHYLHFTSTKHVFAPVAIGGFNPPKQVYELYNGGALPLTYQVDTEPLEQLAEENFDHPVLQCLNPQGEVQPGRTALLEWVFFPLEAKTYSVDIPVHILEGDTVLITFEGCGFHTQSLMGSAPLQLFAADQSVPSTQRLLLPNQVVYLSEERVSLGDIPVCSRSTRVLFLTNVSHTDQVLYTWNIADQVVKIQPDHGSLSPGKSALCILTLQASGSPRFYQTDLICEVTKEEDLAHYRLDLQQWEQERDRKENEFTITEKDLEQTCSIPQECKPSPQRTGPTVKKYKTLPSIRRSSALVGDRSSRAERRAQIEASRVWRRPEPPRPFLLHLGVTARSHCLLEFQTYFPSLLSSHYVNRSPQPNVAQSGSGQIRSGDTPLLSHGPEREIITHTLTAILRTLLDEPEFHRSLLNAVAEPVPYFSQMRETTLSRAPSPTHPGTSTPYPGVTQREAPPPYPPTPQLLMGGKLCNAGVTESQATGQPNRPPPSGPQPNKPPPSGPQPNRPSPSRPQPNNPPPSGPQPNRPQPNRPPPGGPQPNKPPPNGLQTLEVVKMELSVQETIRRLPEFCDLAEDVLLNTLQNLMMEAFLGELVLTARPRIITLPPISRRTSCGSRRLSRGDVDPEEQRNQGSAQGLSPNLTN
ncbi:hypothetical protein UPYG_G00159560 [Umbra pygmaea]|uniref:Coiled-coil domain-containing protein 108 n=1 Tax=Umbra pygmaea TaxID=75934 RepID=A0ABD0WZ52_UMBPY